MEASESEEDGSFMAESDNEINECLGEVSINTINDDQKWMVCAQVTKCEGGQKPVDFKLDTGASVSCLPSRLFRKNCKYLEKPKVKLLTADKKPLQTRGVVTLDLEYDGKKVTEDFYVVENLKTPLLGLPAIENLKIITRAVDSADRKTRPKVFKSVYNNPGKMVVDSRKPYESFDRKYLQSRPKSKKNHEYSFNRPTKPWLSGSKILREGMRYKIGSQREMMWRYKFPMSYPPEMFVPPGSCLGGETA